VGKGKGMDINPERIQCPTLKRLMIIELRLLEETRYSSNNDPKLELWEKTLQAIRNLYHGPLPDFADDGGGH
jgi:hypothetical protein